MTITNVTTGLAATSSSAGGNSTSTATTSTGGDFNTFLNLLTTQLKNQDPLDPMDSTQFATQLATFSSVEQQTKTNELLDGMTAKLNLSNMSQLAGWVGQQARADMDVAYDGTPVTLFPTFDSAGDSARLVVRDQSGTIVASEAIPDGATSFDWKGTASDGSPLAAGTYSFEVQNLTDGTVVSTTPVESYGEIQEARGGSDDTILVFKGGIEVSASKITALRNG